MKGVSSPVTACKDPKLPPPLVPSEATDWTSALTSIGPADAETLLAVVRTLYPHDALPERVYRRVVLHLDRLGAGETLSVFCQDISAVWPTPYAELAESYRTRVLKAFENRSDFFFIQRMTVRYLYDDVELWAAFGYQGASVHLGGYVTRGFDDLDWLPPLPNDL